MPDLIESNEWRLLQHLAKLLTPRKAPYRLQVNRGQQSQPISASIELFEIELRKLLTIRDYPCNLQRKDLDSCNAKLTNICLLLDDLAKRRLPHQHTHSQNQPYPWLRNLANIIENTTETLDLVYGSQQKLFGVPSGPELGNYLLQATECNNLLSRLIYAPLCDQEGDSVQSRRKSEIWKASKNRNRAKFVIGVLFEQFRCQASHEILLRLVEDSDSSSVLPELQLFLSLCSQIELWQDIRCHSDDITENSISSILDICADLRENAGQGKTLTLLVKRYALFGTWSAKTPSPCDQHQYQHQQVHQHQQSRRSLDQLILDGAFRPINIDILFHGAPQATFNKRDKRALAVKLGFCLMDFFDLDVATKTIHFLQSPLQPDKDIPYLAVDSKAPNSSQMSYNFEVGHPTLLSFAKLLLELEFGQKIDIDIHHDNKKNRDAWYKLLSRVEQLEEQDMNDSYLQAVRSCLVVHRKLARALRNCDNDKNAADMTIRKRLYKEVVYKLECGLDATCPRQRHQRQRSQSPPPPPLPYPLSSIIPTINESDDENAQKRQRTGIYRTESVSSIATSKAPWSKGNAPSQREDFKVAIVCALPLEYNAVIYALDEIWDEFGSFYGKAAGDPNIYTTGRMGNYDVVVARLPNIGKASAASAAASMRSSFTNLRLALISGVCGAVPFYKNTTEILLGDVIISKTAVQYDFGRRYEHGFKRKDTVEDCLARPSREVRSLISIFETDLGIDNLEDRTAQFLRLLQDKMHNTKREGKYDYPGPTEDKLYEAHYSHKHYISPPHYSLQCDCRSELVCSKALGLSCSQLGCEEKYLVTRSRLRKLGKQVQSRPNAGIIAQPRVHIGAVATGDTVIKSAAHRDRLAEEADVIGFEMEGAGVWDEVPTIIVKGTSDYADCHKSKSWQDFAAATAACVCKAILERYLVVDGSMSAM